MSLADVLNDAADAVEAAELPSDPFEAAEVFDAAIQLDVQLTALVRQIARQHRTIDGRWARWEAKKDRNPPGWRRFGCPLGLLFAAPAAVAALARKAGVGAGTAQNHHSVQPRSVKP